MDGYTIGNGGGGYTIAGGGMGGGGGYEMGGGYVTIGADLDALKQGIAEAEQMLRDFVNRSHNVSIGGNFGQSGGGGGGSGYAIASSPLAMMYRDAMGVHAVGNADIEGAADEAADNAQRIAQRASEKLQSRGGYGMGRSPLSSYGIAARLGVGIGSVIAAEEALSISTGFIEANRIAAHPERIAMGFTPVMDQYGIGGTPVMQMESTALANIAAQQKAIGTLESVPALGMLVKFADAVGGTSDSLSIRQAMAQRTIQAEQGILQAGAQADAGIARARGYDADALRVERNERTLPFRSLAEQLPSLLVQAVHEQAADQNDYGVSGRRMGRPGSATPIERLDPQLAGQIRAAQDAQATLQKVEEEYRLRIDQSERETRNRLGGQYAAGYTAQLRAQAINDLANRDPGAEQRALELRQRAEYQDFATKAATDFDNAKNPEEQDAVRQRTLGARAELEAKQNKERVDLQRNVDQQIRELAAQGDAEVLRAHQQFYAADLREFAAYADKMREAVKGKTQAQIDAVESAIGNRWEAMNAGRNWQVASSVIDAQARYNAAGFEMQRMPVDARLAMMDAGEAVRMHGIESPLQAFMESMAYSRERQNVVFQDQRNLAIQQYQMSAGTTAADYTIRNMGMSAQATHAVEQARVAIANADPRARQDAIAYETAQLQAMAHQQFGYHSGGVSMATGSLDEALAATGFGMDLGSEARDRRNAQNLINGGIGQLGTPIPGTTPQGGFDFKGIENGIISAVKAALKGVTLFSPGS